MKKRIIWNDIIGNRLLAVTTWLFMAISAFMFALTCFLCVSLMTSVDTLMEKAQTPDFLQMHAGEVSETELVRFALFSCRQHSGQRRRCTEREF